MIVRYHPDALEEADQATREGTYQPDSRAREPGSNSGQLRSFFPLREFP